VAQDVKLACCRHDEQVQLARLAGKLADASSLKSRG
jgi:hypothetical protein